MADTDKNEPKLTLADALREFLRGQKDASATARRNDVSKFVRWMGEERIVAEIAPSEIGEYSDAHYSRSSTPDYEQLRSIREFLSFLRKKNYIAVSLATHIRLKHLSSRRATNAKASQRQQQEKVVQLTAGGHESLQKELEALNEEKAKLATEIQRALADGDVRENAPLDAARNEQSTVVTRISEIENTLKFATIVSASSSSYVKFGSSVVLSSPSLPKDMEYQIVSPDESNPIKGKISSESPVGHALMNKKVQDQVTVSVPSGDKVQYTIKQIK